MIEAVISILHLYCISEEWIFQNITLFLTYSSVSPSPYLKPFSDLKTEFPKTKTVSKSNEQDSMHLESDAKFSCSTRSGVLATARTPRLFNRPLSIQPSRSPQRERHFPSVHARLASAPRRSRPSEHATPHRARRPSALATACSPLRAC